MLPFQKTPHEEPDLKMGGCFWPAPRNSPTKGNHGKIAQFKKRDQEKKAPLVGAKYFKKRIQMTPQKKKGMCPRRMDAGRGAPDRGKPIKTPHKRDREKNVHQETTRRYI